MPNLCQKIVISVGQTVSEVKSRTFVKPGNYRGKLVPEEGFTPGVGVIGLVCMSIEWRMTDKDIHIGEFAKLLCGPEVVPLVRA